MGLMLLVSKEISLNDFILCMNFISASQLFLNLVHSVLKPQKINIIRDYIPSHFLFCRFDVFRQVEKSRFQKDFFFSNSFFIQVFDRVEIWERHIVFKKTYETHTYHLQNWLVLNIILFFALIQNMCVTDIYKKSHFYYK